MAEFEYWRQSDSRITMTSVLPCTHTVSQARPREVGRDGYLVVARILANERDLCDPVREPADDVDGDDSEDKFSDLSVGAAPAGGARPSLRPHTPQLNDHQHVEYQDEAQWS